MTRGHPHDFGKSAATFPPVACRQVHERAPDSRNECVFRTIARHRPIRSSSRDANRGDRRAERTRISQFSVSGRQRHRKNESGPSRSSGARRTQPTRLKAAALLALRRPRGPIPRLTGDSVTPVCARSRAPRSRPYSTLFNHRRAALPPFLGDLRPKGARIRDHVPAPRHCGPRAAAGNATVTRVTLSRRRIVLQLNVARESRLVTRLFVKPPIDFADIFLPGIISESVSLNIYRFF